jgi:hypothetical protein
VFSASSTQNRGGAGLGWVGAPKTIIEETRLSRAPVLPHDSLTLACNVGRELGNERRGVVLKDVMDGKSKRLRVNVRPVLATELEVIPESLEVMPISYSLSTSTSDDEPGKAKRRRRARDSRVSGVKSLCELAREP